MYIMLSKIRIMKIRLNVGRFLLAFVVVLLAGCGAASAQGLLPVVQPDVAANLLRDKHTGLVQALASNVYGRPLYLDSLQTSNRVTGNAFAVLNAPFALVSSSFKSPQRVCDLIILHINTKYCRPTLDTSPSLLNVNFGKKTAQPLNDTFALEFAMATSASTPGYLHVQLQAEKGPLGTSDYRIELAVIPLAGDKTFLHLRYSYGFGLAGKLAMQAYLTTAGSSKIGFTRVPAAGSEQGISKGYVGGMRGAVERNTMRYYLAIDAYLLSLAAPPAQQLNTRLETWFDSTEQYSLQLRETDKASYLAMKKSEVQRQQSALPER